MPSEFELTTAKSLAEGRAMIEKSAPYAVVSELLLDDGPSFSLFSQLARGSGRKIPVIVFSGMDHVEDIQETLVCGVSGYFVKGQNTISEVRQMLLNFNQ